MPTIDFSRFHRYDELMAVLAAFAAEHPQLTTLSTLGTSHEGRAIPLLTLTNAATGAAEDKPASWVDGNIHSIELTACSAALRFIQMLLEGYGRDADITRALDTRAFYIAPRINPDGAEWALADRPRYVRSSTRRYPFDEEPLSGLVAEDIDGDGRIVQMRVPDPNGAWKKHPDDPRLMVRRDPVESGGTYYRVLPEGRIADYDGSSITLAGMSGSAQGLDLNRNFPANWRQEHEQTGAGPYPTSEPEVRAVVDFFVSHPNICNGTSLHTFSGVLLRPFGNQPDDAMPPEDLWTFQAIGRKGEELTGYPAISVWHDFKYVPNQFISGTFDWIYEHLGLFTWTIEIWNPKKEAGIDNQEWIHWFRDHPIDDDLKMLRWADTVAPGVGFVDWTPFQHPQLGAVEIGGWNRIALFSNPPPACRAAEIERLPRWLLWQALLSPQLQLRATEVTPLEADTWRVRMVVQNAGWLPTYVTKRALQRKLLRGVLAEVELPATATLLTGERRAELGELEGRAYLHTGISFWPDRTPTADRAHVDWIVRAPAGTTLVLTVAHERAGRVRAEVTLTR